MGDKKIELTRRKVLGSVGAMGVASAGVGAGTMAYFNDEEISENNTVTAGKLNLQLDWWQKYYQGEARGFKSDHQNLTDNPGPIFQIADAKPGDWGCGLISIHLYNNPAYVWAGCDLEEWENGETEPEALVDDTEGGDLADHIRVGLLRFDRRSGDRNSADMTDYKNGMLDELEGGRDLASITSCVPVFEGTLSELCDGHLHGGHLLDGGTEKGMDGMCFQNSSTYFYGFCWWIPGTVGNIIQSDKLNMALKFGAVQCRHVDDPAPHNPFAPESTASGT